MDISNCVDLCFKKLRSNQNLRHTCNWFCNFHFAFKEFRFCWPWSMFFLTQGLAFNDWGNPWFLLQFLMSCTMGFVLNYSIVLCTHYNSALTTNIVGVLKVIIARKLCSTIFANWLICVSFKSWVFRRKQY